MLMLNTKLSLSFIVIVIVIHCHCHYVNVLNVNNADSIMHSQSTTNCTYIDGTYSDKH